MALCSWIDVSVVFGIASSKLALDTADIYINEGAKLSKIGVIVLLDVSKTPTQTF